MIFLSLIDNALLGLFVFQNIIFYDLDHSCSFKSRSPSLLFKFLEFIEIQIIMFYGDYLFFC